MTPIPDLKSYLPREKNGCLRLERHSRAIDVLQIIALVCLLVTILAIVGPSLPRWLP